MTRPSIRLITLLPPSPSEACELELSALASHPDYQTECVFGGPMPKAMIERNEHILIAYRSARAKIIAKYGVFDEYLQPLLEEERSLSTKLAETRKEIAELRGLRTGKK